MSSYNNILEYDLFIFDFDGVIINSEPLHNIFWNKVLKKYNINFDYYNYCKIFHTLEIDGIKKNLEQFYNITNFDVLSNEKNNHYYDFLNNNDIKLISHIHDLLKFLSDNNKIIIIASNTFKKNVEFILNKYFKDIKIDIIISREDIKNKKPSPEIYNIIYDKYINKKTIIFEDSLTGITSIYNSKFNNINNKIFFVNNDNYYYYNFIINNYKNIINIHNYNLNKLNHLLQLS
jgi:beta-phosphoglucomutase-like phosphatase (HAD superfamily)